MELKHGYIQNPESIPANCTGAGWIYFSEDDKSIYLDSGNGPVKYSGTGKGSDVDLSNYYTKEETNNAIEDMVPSLDGYATEDFVTEQIENLESIGDLVIEKDIIVTGVNVGNLESGKTIPEGTTLTSFLEMMLCKTIGVKTVNPAVNLIGASLGNTYEVGTSVNLELGYTFTDGKFKGESGYNYNIDAGCEVKSATYYKNNSALTSNVDQLIVSEGNTNYKVTVEYDKSTAIPVDNMGNNIDVEIPAGTTSSTKTIKGAYKYFMGYSDKTNFDQFTSNDVRNLSIKSDFINGKTVIVDSNTITSNGTSIVIACPKKYSLISIQNGLGANIISNFKSGIVNVVTENVETEYTVYIYPITNGAEVEFKNVIIE